MNPRPGLDQLSLPTVAKQGGDSDGCRQGGPEPGGTLTLPPPSSGIAPGELPELCDPPQASEPPR